MMPSGWGLQRIHCRGQAIGLIHTMGICVCEFVCECECVCQMTHATHTLVCAQAKQSQHACLPKCTSKSLCIYVWHT